MITIERFDGGPYGLGFYSLKVRDITRFIVFDRANLNTPFIYRRNGGIVVLAWRAFCIVVAPFGAAK